MALFFSTEDTICTPHNTGEHKTEKLDGSPNCCMSFYNMIQSCLHLILAQSFLHKIKWTQLLGKMYMLNQLWSKWSMFHLKDELPMREKKKELEQLVGHHRQSNRVTRDRNTTISYRTHKIKCTTWSINCNLQRRENVNFAFLLNYGVIWYALEY